MAKLMSASDNAAKNGVQHIVVAVAADGRLRINGSMGMVEALMNDNDLYSSLSLLLKANYVRDGLVNGSAGNCPYPRLPCSPFSDAWKKVSSVAVRALLNSMMAAYGHARPGARRSLVMGEAPRGWPEEFPSEDFHGASRSGLKSLTLPKSLFHF